MMDNEKIEKVEDYSTEYSNDTELDGVTDNELTEKESLIAVSENVEEENAEQIEETKPVSRVKKFFSVFSTVVLLVVTVVMAITVVLNSFVFFKVRVSGPSMQPTLYTGNLLLANKYGKVVRGAIIIIKDEKPDSDDWLIKRVIGVGGDTIEFVNGYVKVNGEFIDEPYVKQQGVTVDPEQSKYVISEGEIFYLGDNRTESADSRTFGTCTTNQVVGVVENWSMLFKDWFNR